MPETIQTTQPINSIDAAFGSLPESIREWLASDVVTYAVGTINTRLGFKDEKRRIIPTLILRLVVQDIDPLNFINELSHQLNISFQNAKTIAQDIENDILKDHEDSLRKEVGIDIKLIYFGKPGAKTAEPEIQPETTTVPEQQMQAEIPAITEPAPATTEIKIEEPVKEPEAVPAAKLEEIAVVTPPQTSATIIAPIIPIIPSVYPHEETNGQQPASPIIIQRQDSIKPIMPEFGKGSLVLDVDRATKEFIPEKEIEKSVPAKLEIEEEEVATTKEPTKVVHYSTYRTPLTIFGSSQNAEPKRENLIKVENIPVTQGSTIDLRQEKAKTQAGKEEPPPFKL